MTETTPYYLQGITGYTKAVNVYRERGWEGTLPLPKDKKHPPPRGFTGDGAPFPSMQDLTAWMAEFEQGNLGLRLPKGIVGIDVDSYGNKPGGLSFHELLAELGPLPSTWISTARYGLGDTTSGIRFYRAGEDVKFKGNPKSGIEIIQHHHRYACVWPSWNPKVDAYYVWYGPDGRETDPPAVHELPLLPPEWVEGLRARTDEEKKGVGWDGADGPGDLKGVDGYAKLTERYIQRVHSGASCHDTALALGNQLRDNGCARDDAMQMCAVAYFAGTKDYTDRPEYSLAEVQKCFGWAYDAESRDPLPRFKTHADLMPPPTDPMAVAGELIQRWSRSNVSLLQRWREGWYRWQEMSGWSEITAESVRNDVYRVLEHAYYDKLNPDTGELEPQMWLPNVSKIKNVMEALTAVCEMADGIEEPSWLGPRHEPDPNEIVVCRNGLLHVNSRTLLPPDPAFFSQTALGLDYDQRAGEPVEWLKFLNSLWPDDPESINALAEVFGYLISGRTDLQKIVLIIGPPRAGKGTIAKVLSELVGKRNIASPTLMSLGSHFGLQALIGKSLAIIGDARVEGNGSKEVVAKLLGISGEDAVSIDRKNRSYWTGQLGVRFVILTNEIPDLRDAGGALAKRYVPLNLTRSWYGAEDPQLARKLMNELPGIMNWALDGYDRVRTSGRITIPQASVDVYETLQDMGSPMASFIEEMCVKGGEVLATTLYEAWCNWAIVRGFHPGAVNRLGRDLRAVMPEIKRSRVSVDGKQVWRYVGVSLRTHG